MLIRYTWDFTEVRMVVLVPLMSRGSFLQAESNKCIRKLVIELLTLGQSEDACIFHSGTNHLTLSFSKYLSFSLCPHEPGLLSSTSKSSLFFSLHAVLVPAALIHNQVSSAFEVFPAEKLHLL